MANLVLITAGGSGVRTGNAVPKQFLTVYDTPIIAYTMENIQQIPSVDEIYVIGPAGWEKFVSSYAEQLKIDKFRGMITGGTTRHESVYNGLKALKEHSKHTYVVLTDANRPLVPHNVFQECIDAARQNDCTVATTPCYDSMYVSDSDILNGMADRTKLFNGQCPECARLGDLLEIYERAEKDGITNLPAAGLFLHYGKVVSSVHGSARGFKITTAEDIELFKAMVKASKQ